VRKHLPNLLTLLNLGCGTVAIVLALEGHWRVAVYLVLVASLFDFLDGMAARMLKAYSDTGKVLDSLADMVTFGVLPAMFIYAILKELLLSQPADASLRWPFMQWIILGSVVLVPLFSAIRLARFTSEDAPGSYFLGLPTPAHTLFWTGLYWQFMRDGTLFGTPLHIYFMWAIMWIMAFHMILPVPLLNLKFEHFRPGGNLARYLVLLMALLILLLTGLPGLSLVILAYILLSLLNLLLGRRVSR
jgi:CDP-diacylglycerol--serine O-phosphatidyltransferase